MKKVFCLVFAVMMIFVFVACGANNTTPAADDSTKTPDSNVNDTTPAADDKTDDKTDDKNLVEGLEIEEGAEILVWESSGDDAEFMKKMGEKFTAEYGIPVTVQEVEAPDARERLAQDGPAGTGADVFAAPHDHTGALVASGLVLENAFAKDMNDTVISSALQAVTYEGKLYGYPSSIETYALFYNKDVYPEAPKSWDEIVKKGKDYTDVSNNQFAFIYDVGNAYYSIGWVFSKGGYIFGNNESDKNDIGLDSANAIAGVNELMKLHDVFPVKAEDCGWDTFHGLFLEGKNASMINGPWAISSVKESGVNYGIAPLPKLSDGSTMKSFSGVRSMFVSAYSQYPNAAALFGKFLSKHENQMERFTFQGRIPVTKAAQSESTITNDADIAAFVAQSANSIPMPSIPEVGLFWTPAANAFKTIWNEQVSAEEGMKTAAQDIRDAIAEQE